MKVAEYAALSVRYNLTCYNCIYILSVVALDKSNMELLAFLGAKH